MTKRTAAYKIRVSVKNTDLDVVFLVLGLLLSISIWLLQPPHAYRYHLAAWGALTTIYLCWSLLPINYLMIKKSRPGYFDLTLFRKGKLQWCKEVHWDGKWWNYTRILNAENGIGYTNDKIDYSKSKGTGNVDASGVPTRVTLQLRFLDTSEEPIILYEDMPNWASTPHWKYKLDIPEDAQIHIECKRLKKVACWLEAELA